jgi:hypothetical protein
MRLLFAVLISFVLLALPAAAGPVVTVLSDSGNVYSHSGSYVLGWEFSVGSPVQVTSLGFWDYLGDGFHTVTGGPASVDVGIWSADQTLLVSTTVAGTDSISNVLPDGSGFRFDSLTSPYTLQPGTYYIGGTNNSTESYVFYPGSSVSYDPAVTWLSGQYAYSGTLVFPGTSDCCTPAGWFGPNFTIGSDTVPEPGTGALFVGAGLWLAWLKRRRW